MSIPVIKKKLVRFLKRAMGGLINSYIENTNSYTCVFEYSCISYIVRDNTLVIRTENSGHMAKTNNDKFKYML